MVRGNFKIQSTLFDKLINYNILSSTQQRLQEELTLSVSKASIFYVTSEYNSFSGTQKQLSTTHPTVI